MPIYIVSIFLFLFNEEAPFYWLFEREGTIFWVNLEGGVWSFFIYVQNYAGGGLEFHFNGPWSTLRAGHCYWYGFNSIFY